VTELDNDTSGRTGTRSSRLARWVASVGGVGYAPVVPGTFGSLPGLLIVAVFYRWPWALAALVAAGIPVAIWAAELAERDHRCKDPRWVVVDETLGMMVAMTFVKGPWIVWPAAFVLFRIFDIVKPYPAGRVEKFHGGVGVVLDDLMAGLYTNIVLQILLAGHVISEFALG